MQFCIGPLIKFGSSNPIVAVRARCPTSGIHFPSIFAMLYSMVLSMHGECMGREQSHIGILKGKGVYVKGRRAINQWGGGGPLFQQFKAFMEISGISQISLE